jgi:riboflavin kinase/FMN adenylyltransferase
MQLPQTFTGTVVHGAGLGHRTLGFPTANLNSNSWNLDLSENDYGVYAGFVFIPNDPPRLGVVSIAKNFTFQVPMPTFEVHILDFDADIYGKMLRVELQIHLRSMVPFTSIEQLKAQITSDIESARTTLKGRYEDTFEHSINHE